MFEDYGQPNHIYFLYHGFLIKGNKHDCLEVDLTPGPGATRDTHMKLRRVFSRNPRVCLSSKILRCYVLDRLPMHVALAMHSVVVDRSWHVAPMLSQIHKFFDT